MYRFQIIAHTQPGESIGIVGSAAELGQWDLTKYVALKTNAHGYPLWWTEKAIAVGSQAESKIEYKYVRIDLEGKPQWEALGLNRWIAIAPEDPSLIIVDDGAFGYLQPYTFGYPAIKAAVNVKQESAGLKIMAIGSSVAAGHKAWLLNGWVAQLAKSLQQKYGHQLINVSEVGANTTRTIARFPTVIAPEQPDIVIIALSLGNEGLAYCPPQERRILQRRFESGIQRLIKMVRDLGALPVLGGVYGHNHYSAAHYQLLKDTHYRMLNWGIPVLNWLEAVDDGEGRWQEGISSDPAHPNQIGHNLMHQAIALEIFDLSKAELARERQSFERAYSIYLDDHGFHVFLEEKHLRIINPSPYAYHISPHWQKLQTAIQRQAKLIPGIYIPQDLDHKNQLPYFYVQEDGTIATTLTVPAASDLTYGAVFNLFTADNPQLLFHDGCLAVLRSGDRHVWIINESDHEYNLQPMWQEVSTALKHLPAGVYDDPLHQDLPFRTMMIDQSGLVSRVKAPAKSAILLEYKCQLSDINRIAILPLGDRCAVRMMLYKMEYDGPAFPFDLTRSTNIADVADMIENRFEGMWNPDLLYYSPEAGRVYHQKWTGLSFAHEVEDHEDPVNDMSPVYERMRIRYAARSQRFWYTLRHCDKVLFIRTGVCDRSGVIDLMHKLEYQCQGKSFQLLLLSPQSSDQFSDLPNVHHYDFDFNPDRMYDDLGHWLYCTEVMRGILESLGISSKNLFWCPPKPPKDEGQSE